MVNKWSDLVGHSVENLYVIRAIQAEQPDRATFLASTNDDEVPVIVEIIAPDSADISDQRGSWRIAADLRHDNLVRILHTGDTHIDGMPFLCCVKERHDDELAAVLDTRPLTEVEAREVLGAILPCIDYLHRSHFVHGSVNPSTVLAFGERVKLAPDTIRPVGQSRPPSDDINSVGMLTMEMLTGHRGATPDLARMSSPLREIVMACLDTRIRQTLTSAEILRMLNREAEASVPAPAPAPVSTPIPAAPAARETQARPQRNPLFVAAGVLAATLLIAVIWQSRRATETEPVKQQVAKREEVRPNPVLPTEPARQQIQQPAAPVQTAASGSWAVIAAAYRSFEAAQKRAASLRRQWKECDCSVYPEKGQGRTYYVLVGSGLTKNAADRLHRQARLSRLPPDSYVTRLADGATRARRDR
jgi:hypothetical protein